MVDRRATVEGRSDSLYPGLRYYRFSRPTEYRMTQLLMPGIVVVLQGKKTAKIGASSLSYDESSYLVLGREMACNGTVVEARPERPYLAIHLDLPPDVVVDACVALADTPASAAPIEVMDAFVAPIDSKVLHALARLLPATDDAVERRLIAPLVVKEIVVRLLQSEAATAIRSAAGMTRTATRIQRAMRFIHEHYARTLSLDLLAGQVAMSPSHFAHSFRAISGISPMRYLRHVRLDEARRLMLGGMRANEAAEKVGFESAAHFTREFKRRFDASPTHYVERMTAQQD